MPLTTPLFVTGATRSGTSLLDKLLSSHAEMRVLSQPLPLVYVEVKRAYLGACGDGLAAGTLAYPLNDLFGSNYRDPEQFTRYLRTHTLEPDWIRAVLERMAHYEGQYFRAGQPVGALTPSAPLPLSEFVLGYLRTAAEEDGRRVLGAKEVFAEEYIPYLLESGWNVVHVVRDPRDVAASAFSGRGPELTGAGRPLLFVLRQWRKSVAFALECAVHPRVRVLRYEDIVGNPRAALDGISEWLGCAAFAEGIEGAELRDFRGEVWRSNSSHGSATQISRGSVGAYRDRLSPEVVCAIETLCGPEMQAFGYLEAPSARGEDLESVVRAAHDPCERPRADLLDYAWGAKFIPDEQARLSGLESGHFVARFHLFRRAFDQLRRRAVDAAQ